MTQKRTVHMPITGIHSGTSYTRPVSLSSEPWDVSSVPPEPKPITRASKVSVTGYSTDGRGLDGTSNNYTQRPTVDALISGDGFAARLEH